MAKQDESIQTQKEVQSRAESYWDSKMGGGYNPPAPLG